MRNKIQIIIPEEILINKIYFLRGQKIMLDRDLADLYEVQAKHLRERVKKNIDRFPKTFMFQLNQKEVDLLISKSIIPSMQHLGGTLPYAFTEHGILMLSNVLKSKQAKEMSIRIIEIFIKMREIYLTHKDILLQLEKLEKQVGQNSIDIGKIFTVLRQLLTKPNEPRKKIGYK